MSSGNPADGIGHGEDGQAESHGDTDKADAEMRKGGGKHGATAAAEHQPERSEEFSCELSRHFPGLRVKLWRSRQPAMLHRRANASS